MSNPIIEAQRIMLENLDQSGGSNPPLVLDDPGSGAPPPADQAGVPGQEPHASSAPGAAAHALPAGDPHTPPPGSADVGALEQQIASLTQQKQEFESLYRRQQGMVAPLQRKNNALEETVRELQRQVEDLKAQGTPRPGSPASPQAPQAPTAATAQGADDPELQEFMTLYGDMAPGLKAFLRSLGALGNPQLPAEVKRAVEFVQQHDEENQRSAVISTHLAPLYAKHPDAGNIVRTPQFAQWIEAKPSYIRESIKEKVISPELYPVEQVIAIFDDFAATNTMAPPAPPAPSPGVMATDVRRVQTSATPGGKPPLQPLTRERMAQINRALTVDRGLYTDDQVAALRAELDQGEVAALAAGFGMAPRLDTLTR